MEPESPDEFSKLHWIFMYSIWALAELLTLASFVYSIYSVIILMFGKWEGAAVFVGMAIGYFPTYAVLSLCMLSRVPWHAGDYQSGLHYDYQVKQVRLFHTILWNEEKSEAQPHIEIKTNFLDSIGKKGESFVYRIRGHSGYVFKGRKRWLVYVWAVSCEIFLLGIFFLPLFFMMWVGIGATFSFLSGSMLFSTVLGFRFSRFYGGKPLIEYGTHAGGLAWAIEDAGSLYLRHFILLKML